MTNENSTIKTKQETNIFQGSMAREEWTIKQGIKEFQGWMTSPRIL
jgi:hypothetical protein